MSLEAKYQELKDHVSSYDIQWFLGDLSDVNVLVKINKYKKCRRNHI